MKHTTLKRPLRITGLMLGMLLIGGLGLVRSALTVLDWQFLTVLSGHNVWYMLVSGCIWCAAGGWALWGLARRRGWARPWCVGVAMACTAYFWLERILLFDRQPGAAYQLPEHAAFALVVNILLLGFTFFALWSAKGRTYFTE